MLVAPADSRACVWGSTRQGGSPSDRLLGHWSCRAQAMRLHPSASICWMRAGVALCSGTALWQPPTAVPCWHCMTSLMPCRTHNGLTQQLQVPFYCSTCMRNRTKTSHCKYTIKPLRKVCWPTVHVLRSKELAKPNSCGVCMQS